MGLFSRKPVKIEAQAAPQLMTDSLFALGLALFVITFIVLALAKLMLARMEASQGKKT